MRGLAEVAGKEPGSLVGELAIASALHQSAGCP